jgi:hypothetical protein
MRCQRKRLHENPKQTGKDDRRLSRSRRGGAVTPTGAFLPSRTKTWGELPGRRPERALRNRDGNCYAETLPAVIYRVDMSNDSVPNFCLGLRPDSIVSTAPPSQGSDGRSPRPIGRTVRSRGSSGTAPIARPSAVGVIASCDLTRRLAPAAAKENFNFFFLPGCRAARHQIRDRAVGSAGPTCYL